MTTTDAALVSRALTGSNRAWTELEPEADPVIAREYAWALAETKLRCVEVRLDPPVNEARGIRTSPVPRP